MTSTQSQALVIGIEGGGGGGGVYSESYSRGGAIPNEMGSARCRATPALNQSADETRTPGEEEEGVSEVEGTRAGCS